MDLEQEVSTFCRASVAMITLIICVVFLGLLGLFLVKLNEQFSAMPAVFCMVMALLAFWFGKISYTLIFRVHNSRAVLLSPRSILAIFILSGLGIIAGIVYRFSTSDLENGMFGLLVLCLLFPSGHYCWKHAKKRANQYNGI